MNPRDIEDLINKGLDYKQKNPEKSSANMALVAVSINSAGLF